jgi:sodium-dependent dicarboxylate transporter 2/3/5
VTEPRLSESERRFDRARRKVGSILAPTVFVALLVIPVGGLAPPAQRLAAVCAATVILWVTEAMPLGAAALLGPAVAVLLGVCTPAAGFAAFADPLIFLFLGGFLLAGGLSRQRFDRRAALWLIARPIVRGSPRRAFVAIATIAFLFSMWISNTATTAMLLPVALGLCATIRRVAPPDEATQRALHHFGGGMCLILAYSASLGGMATPIGTGPNVIALGMLDQLAGVRIDFLTWMSFALPISIASAAIAVTLGTLAFKPPIERVVGLTDEVSRQLDELGPMHRGERRAIAIFGLAVVGWLTPSLLRLSLGTDDPLTRWATATLNEGTVAIVCACLMFLIPSGRPDPHDQDAGARILDVSVIRELDWDTLLLLGGGLALGRLTFDTGLAEAIGRGVIGGAGPLAAHPLGLMATATLLMIFLTEVTSNTATTSMMLPVLIGIAKASGYDPTSTALITTFAASHAFMLPVSTPPNAMAYGTRMIRIHDMIRLGFRLDLLGYVVLVVAGVTIVPWVLG